MLPVRKIILLFLFTTAVAIGMTACSNEREVYVDVSEKQPDNTFKIFRTDVTESTLLWESGEEPDENLEREALIGRIISMLESRPGDPEMKSLLPRNVTVKSAYFGLDGQLIVSFDKSYNSLSTIEELLLRAGFVKTLCQLDFVDYVEFYVEDNPLILRGDVVPGLMKSTDFIDNTGQTTYFSQEVELTVYFVKRGSRMLGGSTYKVTYDGSSSYEKLATDLLLSNPETDDADFIGTLPEGTVINRITSTDGIAYVDVNEAFLNYRENVGEELTIFSLVNSLCDIPGIMKVQITVNGTGRKAIDKYGQSGLIERRPELIANEKAGEADG